MDNRLFFVIGDILVCLVVGSITGWLSSLIVGVGWNMMVAMILAMLLGMIVGGLLFFPLGMLFGAMEVMLPAMLSGMISGMLVGMWSTMETITQLSGLGYGAVCGMGCLITIWVVNNQVRGIQSNG